MMDRKLYLLAFLCGRRVSFGGLEVKNKNERWDYSLYQPVLKLVSMDEV